MTETNYIKQNTYAHLQHTSFTKKWIYNLQL